MPTIYNENFLIVAGFENLIDLEAKIKRPLPIGSHVTGLRLGLVGPNVAPFYTANVVFGYVWKRTLQNCSKFDNTCV